VNEGIASVLGLPVDVTQGALRLGAAGINAATGSDIQLPVDAIGGSQSIKAAIGPAIQPESKDGSNQVIRRVGQEVGASLVPAGAVVARSATPIRAAIGQAATAAGSGAAAGTAQQLTDNPYVEIAAQIMGGGAVAGAAGLGRKAITPFTIDPERQAVNATLAQEGVELTAGQATGNKALKYAESELGGARLEDLTSRQQEQFTRAALSRAGISADRATPEVMQRAYQSLGAQFDALAARNSIAADPQIVQDLGGAWSEYTALVNPNARAPIVENTIRDIADAIQANGGSISGEAYQSLRSRLGRALNSSADPELTGALRGLQGALDDAMERTLTAANSPDLGAWQQVRGDYHNFMILQNAASGAGEDAAMGIISPAKLRQAATQQNRGGYVRGQGAFSELARAGVAGMSPMPNSGTASRMAVRGMTAGIPGAIGALLGNNVGGGLGAVAGLAAGSVAPKALSAMMLSGPGRRYLTNQVLPNRGNALQMIAGPALGGGANALQALRVTGLN
jgi:hypothetical protein